MGDAYLALDLGTSSVKVVVIDRAGRVVWKAAAGTEEAGWIGIGTEISPEQLWRKTCELTRAAIAAVGRVVALGVTAQLALVLLDDDGCPTFPLMPWSDRRAGGMASALSEKLSGVVGTVAGRSVTADLVAPRLMWVRDQHRAAYEQTRVALTLKDFIVYRLTGIAITDAASASYTMLYDVRAGRWSSELLTACAIPEEIFPKVLRAGEVAGTITETAAAESGTEKGIPVAVGGPDGTLGAVGSGAVAPGVTVDVAGTTDTIFGSVSVPPVYHGGAVVNAFIKPDLWAIGGPTGMTGGALSWIARLSGASSLEEFYQAWGAEMDSVPPGADGVVFVTTLTGERFPTWREDRLGGIDGLRARHSVAHLARAAEEGAACLVAAGVIALAEVGHLTNELRFVGGGSRSERGARLRAEVCGVPVMLMDNYEASALGAAMAAGVACGSFADWDAAAASMVRVKSRITPDPVGSSWAAEVFERWRRAWRTPGDTGTGTASLTGGAGASGNWREGV